MINSGNSLFENYNNEITCIYGSPSSGKTTLAKLAAIEQAKNGKRVVYVDTESGFNLERVKQLAGNDFDKVLENIILFRPKRFSEQYQTIKEIVKLKNISLIIVDTITYFYRAKVKEKPEVYNPLLRKQFRFLKEISYNVPIIITNQVYSKMDGNISMIGGDIVRNGSDKIIKLTIDPRIIKFDFPKGDMFRFDIVDNGVLKK